MVPLLVLGAFLLGAVPFSVIIGQVFLDRDIRTYGDGNPGSVNVFRAGGRLSGFLAVFLDVAKGFPFVYAAHVLFDVPIEWLIVTGLAAILGHAFSPFLRWHGGKSIAVTFGVLLAMPDFGIVLVFAAFIIAGALFVESDAWGVTLGTTGTLAFQFVLHGRSWETLLMAAILLILLVKHVRALRCRPGYHGRLYRWVQGMARDT